MHLLRASACLQDFPNNPALSEKIEAAWKQGKIMSAVCHGPAAFVGPRINDKPLVDGKEVCSSRQACARAY